uniref:SVWC domain-containing protein n=1 Tax=Anopheles maculatus TaxID=74869 RepID=A0A182SNQ6_9DIPT
MKLAINRSVLVAYVLFACLASISQAYVYIVPDAKHPDQEGHCWDDNLKISVPVNEIRQRPEKCESMSCGTDYSLHVAGCGVIAAGPGMTVTKTDYSKPYPDCCPQVVLTSDNFV